MIVSDTDVLIRWLLMYIRFCADPAGLSRVGVRVAASLIHGWPAEGVCYYKAQERRFWSNEDVVVELETLLV